MKLVVPWIAVSRGRDASLVGFQAVPTRQLLQTILVNLGALLLLAALVEPWSHTYKMLVEKAIFAPQPDPTFAWLVRFPGAAGWVGMALFSGLVTIFGEELFFRGWLLQFLARRMRAVWAVLVQAALFSLPQALAALLLPPLQGILYIVVYSWLAIGLVGGWAALRTRSIWPSLVSAVLLNLILTYLVLK